MPEILWSINVAFKSYDYDSDNDVKKESLFVSPFAKRVLNTVKGMFGDSLQCITLNP